MTTGSASRSCEACGAVLPGAFRFCGACGAPVATSESEPGERRQVTILFADLAGFSTLAEHMDPEDLHLLMSDLLGGLSEEIERRGGVVGKFIGDAVMAVFGAPVAQEDDPSRAVDAAMAMHDSVRQRSAERAALLTLRIGINTGLVVTARIGDRGPSDVIGDAVNVAARLQAAARPGDVLASGSTWRRLRGCFVGESVGEISVRGRTRPVDAYRITARSGSAPRRLTPFVGRERELALLEELWSRARDGDTQIVTVIGSPGVGKSRLLAEFPRRAGAGDVRITCRGDRVLGAAVDLVEGLLGEGPVDAAELAARASRLGLTEAEALALAAMTGMGEGRSPPGTPAGGGGARAFNAVWRLFEAACRRRSTLVVLDDLHWADRSTQVMVSWLVDRLAGVPLMLVVSLREGWAPPFAACSAHTEVVLEGLSDDYAATAIRGALGVRAVSPQLERLVLDRAEGNPFFVEAIVEAIAEAGSLELTDGTATLRADPGVLPDSIRSMILARFDRLGEAERMVARQAAVIGRSGAVDLLEAVTGAELVAEALPGLARSGILAQAGPGTWAFRHALIQEAVYGTLLHRHRRQLHLGVAGALEARTGRDPGLLEALAEHYASAGEHQRARRAAVAAGDAALERLGGLAAQHVYERAIQLWGEGDEGGRLGVLVKLGRVAFLTGDLRAAHAATEEAAIGWQRFGRPIEAGAAWTLLGRTLWGQGQNARAREVVEHAIATLEPLEPSEALVDAYWTAAQNMSSHETADAAHMAERGLAMADALGHDVLRAHLMSTLGVARFAMGDLDGIDLLRRASVLGRRSGDLYALARAYANLTDCLATSGELREAVSVARQGRRLVTTGHRFGVQYLLGSEALALADLARLQEAEALADRVLRELTTASSQSVLTFPAVVARTLVRLRRGNIEAAGPAVDELVTLGRRHGTTYLRKALRLAAELAVARGDLAAARPPIAEAIALAKSCGSAIHVVDLLPSMLVAAPREARTALSLPMPPMPLVRARRAEAIAVLDSDRRAAARAARSYRALGMHYDEARVLVCAGRPTATLSILARCGMVLPPAAAGPCGRGEHRSIVL